MMADPTGGAPWTRVRKTADKSISSSTVLAADNHLFFTPASGVVYQLVAVLIYGSPLGAGTPDIKIAWGEDTSTVRGFMNGMGFATNDAISTTVTSSTNQGANWTGGTAAADRGYVFRGIIVGNAGTFTLLWAQNTSDSNATIVRAGSALFYRAIS